MILQEQGGAPGLVTVQNGTLAVILFGTMQSRAGMGSLGGEMRPEMDPLGKERHGRMEALGTDVHRSTTLVTEMLFQHPGRIIQLENK